MTQFKYSVVIPVYNTTSVLLELVDKLQSFFDDIKEPSFEIILVNDCSPNPKTKEYLTQACQNNSHVKVIHFGRNYGQQPATICGIEQSQGEYIITMDDDLQHDPADIRSLIEMQSHDIVIAQLLEKKHSFFRRLSSNIKNHFDHIILSKPKHIKMSSFRLISRFVATNMLKMKSPNPFIPALLFMVSLDVVNVPVKHYPRAEGVSGYNLKSMINLFSNLMINNSSFLLNILGRIGIISSAGSICYASYLVLNKMTTGVEVVGWTSLMVVVLFMGGLLLFSIGVIGEYLIRLIQSTEQKPCYIVKNIESSNE
ncbi:MAG: glycosyltransferase family 2 protein [Pseudomonadales bacterium]|nr:glycosyltransferase family 2 protein [Pseudomonadales bacterium]